MASSRLLIISAAALLSVSACSTGHYTNKIPGSYGSYYKYGGAALKEGNYEEAAENYAFAAKSGHPRALIAYADVIAKGQGVERDPVVALTILQEAYDKSSGFRSKAALSLGRLLLTGGEGPSGTVNADPERARSLLVEALNGGETKAASNLGKIYEDGIGVRENVDKAIGYYEAIAANDATAARRLTHLLVETDAPERKIAAALDNAITQLERQAENGKSRAWVQLSDLYMRGKVTEPDPEKALDYLQNVADDNDPKVLVRLARIHSELGNFDQEEEVLRKAADLGDVKAQTKLAQLFLKNGTGRTNGTVGRYYAERAIAQGSEAAMVFLGLALLKGDVLEADFEIGETLLRRASEAEYPSGMMALGVSLLRSQILERYPGEGESLLEAAAEKGSASAMSALGFAYHTGKGLPQDEAAARLWLQRAADAGHKKAKKFLEEQQSGASAGA